MLGMAHLARLQSQALTETTTYIRSGQIRAGRCVSVVVHTLTAISCCTSIDTSSEVGFCFGVRRPHHVSCRFHIACYQEGSCGSSKHLDHGRVYRLACTKHQECKRFKLDSEHANLESPKRRKSDKDTGCAREGGVCRGTVLESKHTSRGRPVFAIVLGTCARFLSLYHIASDDTTQRNK